MGCLERCLNIMGLYFIFGVAFYSRKTEAAICDSCYMTGNVTSPKEWTAQRQQYITCLRNQMHTRALHDLLLDSSIVNKKVFLLHEINYDDPLVDSIIGTISSLNITFEVISLYQNNTATLLTCCTKQLPEVDSLFIVVAGYSTTVKAVTRARPYYLIGPLYTWIMLQNDNSATALLSSGTFITGDRVTILGDNSEYTSTTQVLNSTDTQICENYTQVSSIILHRVNENISAEHWKSSIGWNLTRKWVSKFSGFHGKVFTVATLPVQYVSFRVNISGVLIYKGFFFDALDHMAKVLDFKLKYVEPPGKTWAEIVYMVVTKQVDFAVGPFTVTAERKEYMDFMFPILTDSLSILMRIPNESTFSSSTLVFEAIQYPVWIAHFCVILFVGTVVWIMIKLLIDLDYFIAKSQKQSPIKAAKNRIKAAFKRTKTKHITAVQVIQNSNNWFGDNNNTNTDNNHNNKNINEEDLNIDNPTPTKTKLDRVKLLVLWRLSIFNIFAAAFAQGYPLPKDSASLRTLMIFMRMFYIVCLSAYTANLTAFLTVQKVPIPINSLEELVTQKEYKVGCLGDSVHQQIFEHATSGMFQRVWTKIQEDQANNLPTQVSDGLKKVTDPNEKFIYITEKTLSDVAMAYDCSLGVAKELFFPRSMAFPIQKGSPYTPIFSKVLMKMHEGGLIEKWLDKYRPANLCNLASTQTSATSMPVASLLGAYELVGFGCFISTCAMIGEILLAKYRNNKQKNKVQPMKIIVQPTNQI